MVVDRSAPRFASSLLVGVACWLAAGCAWLSDVQTIQESSRGGVYLERLPTRGSTASFSAPQRAFQATHPIALDPQLMARILRGVHLQDAPAAGPPRPFAGSSGPIRVFSDEEVEFLAPLITSALTQAAPDQRVRFQVLHHLAARTEATGGILYAHRPTVHVILTQYHSHPDRSPGLDGREALFLPEAARVRDPVTQTWMQVEPSQTVLAVNYDVLGKLPAPFLAKPAAPPAPPTVEMSSPQPGPLAPQKAPASPAELAPVPSPTGPPRSAITAAQADQPHVAPKAVPSPSPEDQPRARGEKPASRTEDVQAMKDLMIKQALELDALREEVRQLRRELADREPETPKPKGKKKSGQIPPKTGP